MPRKPASLGRGQRQAQVVDYETERRRAKPWRSWYSLAIWKQIRARQLTEQPLCERCLKVDRITAATTVNHRIPHRGNWELFVRGPFESCCKPCHDGAVQAEERRPVR